MATSTLNPKKAVSWRSKGKVTKMSTTQTNPAAGSTPSTDGTKPIMITRNILDLDSRQEVRVAKIGEFKPVADMQEFVSRLGNDSSKILEIVNDGLETYATKQLETETSAPWVELTEEDEVKKDEAGNPVTFSGTPLPADKEKSFAATILNMAKSMFGYPDQKLPKGASKAEQDANRKLKADAKQAALDMVLSNPAAVEALKK
jgi:hypothetical protein